MEDKKVKKYKIDFETLGLFVLTTGMTGFVLGAASMLAFFSAVLG